MSTTPDPAQIPLLGHTVIWSISKGPHTGHKVADRFAEAGFSAEIGETSIGNAWRRATAERLPTYSWSAPSSGRRMEARLEKVDVQVIRRKNNVREWMRIVPGHAPKAVMQSRLGRKTKASDKISWATRLIPAALTDGEREQLAPIAAGLDARIEELLTDLDGTKVRSAVRRSLEGELQGIAMRGGVYFVPQRHAGRLSDLEAVFEVLSDCYLQAVPLVDLPSTRSMVLELLIAQTRDDVADLKSLYAPNLAKGGITSYLLGKAQREGEVVRSRTMAYLADLQPQGEADEALWAAQDDLQELLATLAGLEEV